MQPQFEGWKSLTELVKKLSTDEIAGILRKQKIAAAVGLSIKATKPNHSPSAYMKANGYPIILVNPFVEEVLGEKTARPL